MAASNFRSSLVFPWIAGLAYRVLPITPSCSMPGDHHVDSRTQVCIALLAGGADTAERCIKSSQLGEKLRWLAKDFLMSRMKMVVIALMCVPVAALIAFAEFYLPSTAMVRITGSDVKRLDTGRETASGQVVTRDVRFIYARDLKTGKDYAFRNEDTGWGWPIYFKFNSGTIAARANNIKETERDSVVLIKYYGWRVPVFDMYPNVVNLRVVSEDYTHIPIFNIAFIVIAITMVGYVVYRVRRHRRRSFSGD